MRARTLYRLIFLSLAGAILLAIVVTMSSFVASQKIADDVWKQLGITQLQGTEKIKNSFVSGYTDIYGLRNAKNVALNQRAAVVKNLLIYTKSYVSSATFKTYYAQQRKDFKPFEPVKEPRTKEQVRKEMITDMEKSVKDAEKSMAQMTPEIKKIMEESITKTKKQIEEYRQPDNKIVEIRYQGELSNHKYNWDRYNQDLKRWETTYPEDVRVMIKDRLTKYLSIANTVDFDAELVEKYNKKRFVNPAYESKSGDWKMIYRAGPDVYSTTKQFVTEWLKEL